MARRLIDALNRQFAAVLPYLILFGVTAGVPVGSTLGYTVSRDGLEASVLGYPLLAIAYGLSEVGVAIGATLWGFGSKIGPPMLATALSFALGMAGGHLLGPKFDPPEFLAGGTMVIRFDPPMSRTFEVQAGCSTFSDSDVVSHVFTGERLPIGSENVAVTVGFPKATASDQRPSVTVIRTPPATLPTYGSLLGGSATVTTDARHRQGDAVFRAVMGEDGPTLEGIATRELTGTLSWTCGATEIPAGHPS